MAEYLSDQEIVELLQEPKRVPGDFRRRFVPKAKRGHGEVELDVLR